MGARNVQVSLDERLVERVDARPETQELGRSAVIRRALELYLDQALQAEIEAAYARGYGAGGAAEIDAEFAPFLAVQSLPDSEPARKSARPERSARAPKRARKAR